MGNKKLKLLVCRTCIRDNPGQGIFATVDSLTDVYKKGLKKGLFSCSAEMDLQNCFTECENFHCVQLTDSDKGFRLKKISTPEKIETVLQWVKQVEKSGQLELPESLKDNLLETIKLS